MQVGGRCRDPLRQRSLLVSAAKQLDFFERYLSAWVLVCMAIGITAGKAFPPRRFNSAAGSLGKVRRSTWRWLS